jgi:hypothetical protein
MWWRTSLLAAVILGLAWICMSLSLVDATTPTFSPLNTGTIFLSFDFTISWTKLVAAGLVLVVAAWFIVRGSRRHPRD